jgi:hypothetical protein
MTNSKLTGQGGKISGKMLAIGGGIIAVVAGVIVGIVMLTGNSQPAGNPDKNDTGTNQNGNGTSTAKPVWTDADAQTVSVDRKVGHYEVTVWDAKGMTADKVQHPGSSGHTVDYTKGQSAVLYAPFKIVYTNALREPLKEGYSILKSADSDDRAGAAMMYIGLENESAYRSDAKSVGVAGVVQSGQTVVIVGYVEIINVGTETEVDILSAAGSVAGIYFDTDGRARIET